MCQVRCSWEQPGLVEELKKVHILKAVSSLSSEEWGLEKAVSLGRRWIILVFLTERPVGLAFRTITDDIPEENHVFSLYIFWNNASRTTAQWFACRKVQLFRSRFPGLYSKPWAYWCNSRKEELYMNVHESCSRSMSAGNNSKANGAQVSHLWKFLTHKEESLRAWPW